MHIPYGQRHYHVFDHMEFCLVIKLTMGGNWAVTWSPKVDNRFVSFTTTLNTRAQLFKALQAC